MTADIDAERERWRGWARRWDAQQEVYIEQRERVFEVMLSLLEHLVGDEITVLDLGGGLGRSVPVSSPAAPTHGAWRSTSTPCSFTWAATPMGTSTGACGG